MEEKNIEKKEEIKNEKQEIKRPWQGTTWAWTRIAVFALEIFLLVGFSILVFIGASLDTEEPISENYEETVFVENENLDYVIIVYLLIFVSVVFTLLAVLEVFLIVGFFKGWKWSVITDIALNSFYIFINLFSLMFSENLLEVLLYIFVIIFSGFMLYLGISCLKHPFYNQKKVEQKS